MLTIGANAFIGCSSLKSVTIPDSVLTIGGGAFSVCNSLEIFVVSENNSSYKAVDGLLMTKDGRSLVAASGKISTIDIPKGVTNIADSAFYGHTLTNLYIPGSVLGIGKRAFMECRSLESVTIDNGVLHIGESV